MKRLVEKLCALTGPDEKRLREYLAMLEILADNRHLALNLQETYAMLHINLERLAAILILTDFHQPVGAVKQELSIA